MPSKRPTTNDSKSPQSGRGNPKALTKEVQAKGQAALAVWRAARAAAKAEGRLEEWEEEQRLLKLQKGRSPTQAIKQFCLDCVGGKREDITNCTAPKCALFIYRPYQKGSKDVD